MTIASLSTLKPDRRKIATHIPLPLLLISFSSLVVLKSPRTAGRTGCPHLIRHVRVRARRSVCYQGRQPPRHKILHRLHECHDKGDGAPGSAPAAQFVGKKVSTAEDAPTIPFFPITKTSVVANNAVIGPDRSRRIKCDETWPACLACIHSRRECPGYLMTAPPATIAPTLSSTKIVPTSRELLLNDYFRNVMLTYFPDEFNASFWSRSVLQISRSEMAVWHAVNAVAGSKWAMDRRSNATGDFRTMISTECQRQYLMTLKHTLALTQSPQLSERDKTLVLLVNILLSIYWPPPGESRPLHLMISKSLDLIIFWKFWECIDSGPSSTLSTEVIYYFVKAERAMQDCRLETQIETRDWGKAITCLQRRPLASATRAYVEFVMIWSSVRAILDGLPFQSGNKDIASASCKRYVLENQFRIWEVRYGELLRSGEVVDPILVAAMDARIILLNTMLRLDLTKFDNHWDETGWDNFLVNYKMAFAILDLAVTKYKNAPRQDQHTNHFMPLVWNSLNFIARVCRDPILRRKCVALLQTSLQAAIRCFSGPSSQPLVVVSYIITLEETAYPDCNEKHKCIAGAYVCNLHRVARVQLKADGDIITYIFHTTSDVVNNRAGHTIRTKALPVWG